MLKRTQCLHELWITFKQLWGLRQRWWKWPVLTLPQSVSFWKLRQIRGNKESIPKTLPKAQRTRGLSSSCQSHFASSTRNLNQTSASPLHFKFKILTQPSFRISTKIQLQTSTKHQRQNAEQAPVSKSCWNSTSKSWPTLVVLKVWKKV